MEDYNFSEIYTWLIRTFDYGSWSVEHFELYDHRWGWEGTGTNTKIFFKHEADKLLFTLTWIGN